MEMQITQTSQYAVEEQRWRSCSALHEERLKNDNDGFSVVFPRNRPKDPRTRTECRIPPTRTGTFDLQQSWHARPWGKDRLFDKRCWLNWIFHVDTCDHPTASHHPYKPRWMADLNVEGKTIMIPENERRACLRIQRRRRTRQNVKSTRHKGKDGSTRPH